MTNGKEVFIAHGTDHSSLKELKTLLVEVGLIPIILHEQPSKGMTLIEKLEKYSDVEFAFIILTPDDVGMGQLEALQLIPKAIGKKSPTSEEFREFAKTHPLQIQQLTLDLVTLLKERARQNVVLEFGYLIGKLGRDKICCLYKGSIELPSDMHGICYIHFDNSINEVKEAILKELEATSWKFKPHTEILSKSYTEVMSVSIDGIVIPQRLIEILEGYMNGVILMGKALEDEGKKISDALNAYTKGDTVQVKDSYKFQYSGIYEIGEITLSMDATKDPAIYSFRLDLKHK